MNIERAREIKLVWECIAADEPEISTEQLFARTSQACGCDDGDTSTALLLTKDE